MKTKNEVIGTIKIEREYMTADLCLAIILKMEGCRLKRIEPIGQRRFRFCFEEKEKLTPIIQDYFMKSTQEHPYKRFFNEMREIKNLIYNYPLDKFS